MSDEKNLIRTNKLLEEITEEQDILLSKIKNLKKTKEEIIDKEFIGKVKYKSDEMISLANKLNNIFYGEESINSLINDGQKVVESCLKTWVSKRFLTKAKIKKDFLNSYRTYYRGFEDNADLVINKNGFGYIPRWGDRTVYINSFKTVRDIITNIPEVENYVFKKDKKMIYKIFKKYLPKIKLSDSDKLLEIKGTGINVIKFKEDSIYGIKDISLTKKNKIQISRDTWRGWKIKLSDSGQRWDYNEENILLKGDMSHNDRIKLALIPDNIIEEIKKLVSYLEKENKNNWKYYKKMRSELEPFIFAYEI